ncbi:MAG: hypothetical protein WAT77_16875, partial [Paracoccaceae bacterium]
MDGLIALAFVVALAIPVAIIVLIILTVGLRSRVTILEAQVRTLRSQSQMPRPDVPETAFVPSSFPAIKRTDARTTEPADAPLEPQVI